MYDDKLWVIGGMESSGARYNDVWWSEDGKDWTPVEPTDPTNPRRFSARAAHQVVVHDNRLWVIGGADGSTRYNDVWWSEDGADWTKVEPTDPTDPRRFSTRHRHQVVAHNDELWVIGGSEGLFSSKNDVWWSEDNGKTWTKATASADFSTRDGHQAVVHDNRLWVIGGSDVGARNNDVWRSEDGVNWRLGFSDVFQFQ